MGDKELIELVKQYDAIYNIKSMEYRDATLRNAAWEDIARLHGKSVEECKEKWYKLRNCYNNAMRRRKKKSSKGKIFTPWRFEEQMSFLKPHIDGRRLTRGYDDDDNDDPLVSMDTITYVDSPTSPASIASRASTPTSHVSYKIKASPSSNDYFSGIMEMMKSNQDRRPRDHDMDDVDIFFLSMSRMLKKLPILDQIRIKMDLHKAISEAELKQLDLQHSIEFISKME